MKSVLRKSALTLLLVGPLALTACAPVSSGGAPSTAATGQSSAAESSGSASASAEAGSGPVANPKSELLIQTTKSTQARKGYDKVSPACQATAIRFVLSSMGMMAPMLEASKPGSLQKFKDAFAEVQGTTPKEFDGAFSKLEAPVSQGNASPDAAAMEKDGQPIVNYLETTCKDLGTAAG